ncbi:hypothetical protein DCS_00570 [Drechmeria coniospora]|uniref:Uncharacterized protein n=1 Tax=Drechmeria coniospora TaxID=98403 RepID=A0A151GQS6_DRECN|nr:hypothetical protein DCS_00570 [Drechmeria coniospora]KYK59440.1 hypothetical protein DCS_00570 [Drechmeria coniospora]ODA76319.1 hypothetical protein RJ55_08164 [Drechmeria coniospora]
MTQAQGSSPPSAAAVGDGKTSLPAVKESLAFEMQQYELILRFQDAILARQEAAGPSPNRQKQTDSAAPVRESHVHHGKLAPSGTAAATKGRVKPRHVGSGPALSAHARPFATGNTEINPILLEKSDDLIRAEVTLQRQRLERALRDEVEQRRHSKPSVPDKQPFELDVSDVLTKALALVPAVTTPPPVVEAFAANDDEPASDSFDDNTFYSSRHDTPESHMTSRVPHGSEEMQSSTSMQVQQKAAPVAAPVPVPRTADAPQREQVLPTTAAPAPCRELPVPALPPTRTNVVPGLNNYVGGAISAQPNSFNTTTGEQRQAVPWPNAGAEDAQRSVPDLEDTYVDLHPPSPLLRAHAPERVAPSSAQANPMTIADKGPQSSDVAAPRARVAPAQVAALLHEHSTATSPDSSSPGGRHVDKKRGKKKRKKVVRQAAEDMASPSIKPEPRSVSPISAPTYLRPNKRRRQQQGHVVTELEYDPTIVQSFSHDAVLQHPTRPYRAERVPLAYDAGPAPPQRTVGGGLVGQPRYGRDYVDDGRAPVGSRIHSYVPPAAFPLSYPATVDYEPQPPSQSFVGEPRRTYLEYSPRGARFAGRPALEAPAALPPPRHAAPPPRVLVDEYGREYFDPSHPAVQRPSAPLAGPVEASIVYEQQPPRPVSRHALPGPERYGDGGVVYGAPTATYAMPRRVVTQPEYASYERRDGYPHDYAVQPMALPPAGFIEVSGREAPAPRAYPVRAASMLPAEPVRYEPPRGYGRVQSIRPEAPGREYASGSVHPEGRREVMQPYVREYGARPVVDYQHQPTGDGHREIAFIEHPRGATQEIVYTDDARREIYR